MTEEEMLEYCKDNFPFAITTESGWRDIKMVFKDGYEQGQAEAELHKVEDCMSCGKDTEFYESLMKENAELKKSYTDLKIMWNELVDHDRDMFNKTLQLEAQIEKMKCYCNNLNK